MPMEDIAAENKGGADAAAIRYPQCTRQLECARPCACREGFMRAVRGRLLPQDLLCPVHIEGCRDFRGR